LYIVGSVNLQLIRLNKRTASYSESDFEKASGFIDRFSTKITTPNVLTEISDLLPNRAELIFGLTGFIISASENYEPSRQLAGSTSFAQFGLADSSVFEIANQDHLVLTDDGPLYGFLASQGLDVVSVDMVRSI